MRSQAEALVAKMRGDAAFAQDILRQSKEGQLVVAAQQAGFDLEIAEADKLAQLFTQASNPLSENELANITGAGEGDYFSWLDQMNEGA